MRWIKKNFKVPHDMAKEMAEVMGSQGFTNESEWLRAIVRRHINKELARMAFVDDRKLSDVAGGTIADDGGD